MMLTKFARRFYSRSFIKCATVPPIFKASLNKSKNTVSLEGNGLWPVCQFQKLFRRSFYDDFIAKELNNFEPKVSEPVTVVTGTPGIGKTSFGIFAMWKALQFKKIVVYQHYRSPATWTLYNPIAGTIVSSNTPPPELMLEETVIMTLNLL